MIQIVCWKAKNRTRGMAKRFVLYVASIKNIIEMSILIFAVSWNPKNSLQAKGVIIQLEIEWPTVIRLLFQ